MSHTPGFGSVFKIDVASVLTLMVKVESCNEITWEKFLDEITTHDSAGGYQEMGDTGKRKVNPVELVLIWDQAQATHDAVRDAFVGTTAVTFYAGSSTGGDTLQMEAFVHKMSLTFAQDKINRMKLTIQPTGVPAGTVTP